MRPIHQAIYVLLIVGIGACATQDVVGGSGRARFSDYPDSLVAALESACGEPAQTFARPAPDTVECREYLPPKETAAIILTYDGTPEDLPQLVIRFQTSRDGTGFLVQNRVFLNVPRLHGAPLQVPQSAPALNRALDVLYLRAGGMPEPNTQAAPAN